MISIIIPVYKSEKFLNRLNNSLINQSYKDLEIIYVNDGSPDQSQTIIEDFAKLDNRIRLINKVNGGAADALNVGTDAARGKYIMFIDADDCLALEACKQAEDIMEQYNVDMVFWLHTREFLAKNLTEKGPVYFPNDKHFRTDEEILYLRRRMIGLYGKELRNPVSTDYLSSATRKLYRSNVIKENNIKWTDTNLVGSSDVLFNAQLMPYIKSAYYLRQYLYHYTKDNFGSLTKTYGWSLFDKLKNLHNEQEIIVNRFYGNDQVFKDALNNRRALSIINLSLSVSRYAFNPNSVSKMRSFLTDLKYEHALKSISIKYFPVHYKIFFLAARFRLTYIVLLMGKLMRILR